MGGTGVRTDPYRNYNFRVELDGLIVGSFAECSGLSATTETIEYREGGDYTVHKLPGKTTYGDITLKWGATSTYQSGLAPTSDHRQRPTQGWRCAGLRLD